MQRQREALRGKIEELIRLGLNSDSASDPQFVEGLSKRLLRVLRPTSNTVHEHAAAIKQKLRESIISQATGGSNGLSNASTFEKECDFMGKIDSRLLNSFLAMLEQLKTSAVAANYVKYDQPVRDADATSAIVLPLPAAPKPVTASLPLPKVMTVVDAEGFKGPTALRFEVALPEDEANALSVELSHIWVSKEVETKLIRDLLYTFQGITSKHIRYDPRSESYIIDPSLKLPGSVKDTVLCLCELGWLFNKVVVYCNSADGQNMSKGLIVQAFGYALQVP
jgi:hypothetical protein